MLPGTADTAAKFAQVGAQILGSIFQNNQFNRAREDRLNAGNNLLQYVNDNSLPDGYMQNAFQQLLLEYLDKSKGYEDKSGGLLDMLYGGIGDYRSNFDRITTPSNPEDNPTVQFLRSQLEQNGGQLNDAITNALGIAQSGGATPNSQGLFDTLIGHGSTANPYIANLLDIGGHMLQTGGMTNYTQDAGDVAGYFIRNGGMTPETMDLFNSGFANREDAAGGMRRADSLTQAGQNTLGFGQNLIQQLMASGGYDANGQQQFQTGMNGINGMRDFYAQDPMSVLGATGRQAVDGLMNNPFTSQGFNTTQQTLANLMNRPNISANDQAIINASAPGAFGNAAGFDENMGLAQGVAGQNVNALAPWFSQFASQGNDLMSQLMSGGGGFMNSISGGGGGGGSVSYTPMSRDLGPVDPKIQASLEKALAEFEKNPLMGDQEVMSFARDNAGTAARQAALAAQKRAVMLGGPAPTIASGASDSAIKSFADESMALQAQSVQDALMKNAEMKLARSGQQSELARALAQIKLGREQIFGNMNIADANNSLQASTANAQLADSAAGRSLQAQIANSQNNRGLAELAASIFGGMLGSATTQRGQNVDSQTAALGILPQLMTANATSQGNFLDAMGSAAGRGQQQYNANLGAQTEALGQLGQYGSQRNTALASILGALGGASEQLTSRGGNMMDNFTRLVTGAGDNAASRFGAGMGAGADIMGTGMGGMNAGLTGYNNAVNNMNDAMGISTGALGIANDRLGHYANIFRDTTQDATARMKLGGEMTNMGLTNMQGFLDSAGNVLKNDQNYATGMGQIGASLAQTRQDAVNNYGNTSLGFGKLDNDNRALTNTAFNNFLTNLAGGIGANNDTWRLAVAPYNSVLDMMTGYLSGTQGLMGDYSKMFIGGGR